MYHAPFTSDLHNLQGQFMGFRDIILTLYSKRDSYSCFSCPNMFQIFGPKC